eukprot:1156796-Pelagomonas_calceolata.AAC.3
MKVTKRGTASMHHIIITSHSWMTCYTCRKANMHTLIDMILGVLKPKEYIEHSEALLGNSKILLPEALGRKPKSTKFL